MKILAESLSQFLKFTEDGDPIKDMDIGIINLIHTWLAETNAVKGKKYDYEILDDNTINTYCTVSLSKLRINAIPEYIKFNEVLGGFYCDNNNLSNLTGCPEYVAGSFICSRNNLSNLINAPKKVGVDFMASFNKLTSLEGLPNISTHMDVTIGISDNLLKNLKGLPNEIHGNLYINNNPIETLKYFPKVIHGNLYFSESKILNKKTITALCKVHGSIINL